MNNLFNIDGNTVYEKFKYLGSLFCDNRPSKICLEGHVMMMKMVMLVVVVGMMTTMIIVEVVAVVMVVDGSGDDSDNFIFHLISSYKLKNSSLQL